MSPTEIDAERRGSTPGGRLAVAALVAMLTASVGLRLHAAGSRDGATPSYANAETVDLGEGMVIPRAEARPMDLKVTGCGEPVRIRFVQASPYGTDPATEGDPLPSDAVSYVHHGWTFGRRTGPIALNALYFAGRAYRKLADGGPAPSDDLAVKVIVPSSCDVPAANVMEGLRRAKGG